MTTVARSLARLAVFASACLGMPGTRAVQAQQPAASSLVFDRVTVVDVEAGTLLLDQRVVVTGNRITAVGPAAGVPTPSGGRVVDARGKYLIPGLWDMHSHMSVDDPHSAGVDYYPLFIAFGVTGMRDAWSPMPLDTLVRWRQEIVAGTRVGPPRQLLAGLAIGQNDTCGDELPRCIDSLKAAGANFIKGYPISGELAAAARHSGLPFGGHAEDPLEASDSGASVLDHIFDSQMFQYCWKDANNPSESTLERCQDAAAHFRRHGTWWVPTVAISFYLNLEEEKKGVRSPRSRPIAARQHALVHAFWADSVMPDFAGALGPVHSPPIPADTTPDSLGFLRYAQQAGLPIITGTDIARRFLLLLPGLAVHAEMAYLMAEGLPAVDALRAATLNPAKMLHATDSLGTVAAGKLADLVLLDADPLMDVSNTTRIRAVVANGRYFDRVALDRVLAEVRSKNKPEWNARAAQAAQAEEAAQAAQAQAAKEADGKEGDEGQEQTP